MHYLVRLLCPAVVLVLTCTISAPLRADRVDDYIQAEMKNLRIPGLSLAVVKDGRVIKAAGYGLSNVETATPAIPETAYKVASLSKPIIATAVMLLDQRGKLSIDHTVSRYLPDGPPSWAGITIRHLLSHTSGLVRDPPDYHSYTDQPPMAVIASAYPLPLQFKPGERWLYSNIGYYVLAEIITRVAAMPWSDFIPTNMFQPAGLTSTRLPSASAIIPNRRHAHSFFLDRKARACLGSGPKRLPLCP